MTRSVRPWIFPVALLVLAAACGQKSGVASSGGEQQGLGGLGTVVSSPPPAEVTSVPPPGPAAPVTGGAPVTGPAPAPARGGSRVGAAPATPPAPGPPPPAGKADRTGIDDQAKVITIGIHAPVTGAAPLEQRTFDFGKDVYWKFANDQGGILGGYKVRVVFRDDQFSPTVARQRCQEMVENDKVFLLVGGAGADQITSCARYADSVGVPYLSAGVNTHGLQGLRRYFALSMTYAQQAPLLAQLVKNRLGKAKVGLAVLDTPDFDDARAAAVEALRAAGLQVVADERIPKTAGKNETDAAAANLARAGAEVVYVLTSPVVFLLFTKSVRGQLGYDPDLVGPGVTNGLNLVATVGCPDVAKAKFLSPFPQLDVIDSLDPDYRRAYRQYVTNSNPQQQPDDIGIALWGLSKVIRLMLEAGAGSGPALSRESLVAGVVSGRELRTNVFPPLRFSPTNHFGAAQAHLLQADCLPRRSSRRRQRSPRRSSVLASWATSSFGPGSCPAWPPPSPSSPSSACSTSSRRWSSAPSGVPPTPWWPWAWCWSTSPTGCSTSPRASSARWPCSPCTCCTRAACPMGCRWCWRWWSPWPWASPSSAWSSGPSSTPPG